jgi:hypothetical protein
MLRNVKKQLHLSDLINTKWHDICYLLLHRKREGIQMQESLTKEVLKYKKTGKGFRKLVLRISHDVYAYPGRRRGWNEDDCSDFFIQFFPKIPGLIQRFTYDGPPFEAYLAVSLNWQMKSFSSRKRGESFQEGILKKESFWEQYHETESCCDPACEGLSVSDEAAKILRIEDAGTIKSKSTQKRLICLLLKEAMRVNDEMIRAVQQITGADENWLHQCILKLRDRIIARKERLRHLSTRRNNCFYHLTLNHEKLFYAATENEREDLINCIMREKRRLLSVNGEINRVSLSATNTEIAEVLDIPKGSIDSGLFYLKKQFKTG